VHFLYGQWFLHQHRERERADHSRLHPLRSSATTSGHGVRPLRWLLLREQRRAGFDLDMRSWNEQHGLRIECQLL
jgi:hypothetical protein